MRRLFVVLIALVLAVAASALALMAFAILAPSLRDVFAVAAWQGAQTTMDALATPDGLMPFSSAIASFMGLVTATVTLPALIVAAIGEAAKARSLVAYAGGAGLLAAAIAWLGRPSGAPPQADGPLLTAIFLSGAVAGLVYWLLAGRHAATPPARTAPPPR